LINFAIMHDSRPLKPYQSAALLLCVAGIVLCAALNWHDPDRLWRAYLFAFITCWHLTMGGLGLLALGYATGGHWARACRPFYLALAHTLPLVAILFIPIAFNLGQIYPWARETAEGAYALPPAKALYFQTSFFFGRAIGYFAVWLAVLWLLSRFSRRRSAQLDAPAARRAGAFSLVFLVPTITFAAFDWGMSLEPDWYSSIYGGIFTASGVLAAHSLIILAFAAARNTADSHSAELSNDLGNLLLAFLMVFTYLAFSQFLIIWSGNLPGEVTWYIRRFNGGWQTMAVALVAFLYFVPFMLLLSRDRKRSPKRLAGVAAMLLVMTSVHVYWSIIPAIADSGPAWHATNLAVLAALGGGILAAFCWHANRLLIASRNPGGSQET
jgi:hypothetical protein